METRPDETPAYWVSYNKNDLVGRVAACHAQRRELTDKLLAVEINGARSAIAQTFLGGMGIEVGAGSRPFPLPAETKCYYGNIREGAELTKYFGSETVAFPGQVNAQTFAGVPPESQDFVIAAHVIEHIYDPIGAIRAAVNVLKSSGVFICVVPDKRYTWDRDRPPTTLEHLWADSRDGGESTRLQAYIEHGRYAHPALTGKCIPESGIEANARATMQTGMDLHVHAWTGAEFAELLDAIAPSSGFTTEAHVFVVNENIYVLRRNER